MSFRPAHGGCPYRYNTCLKRLIATAGSTLIKCEGKPYLSRSASAVRPSTTASPARTCGKLGTPILRKAGYTPMSSHRLRLLVVAAALVGVSACGGSSDTGNKDDESRSGGAFP